MGICLVVQFTSYKSSCQYLVQNHLRWLQRPPMHHAVPHHFEFHTACWWSNSEIPRNGPLKHQQHCKLPWTIDSNSYLPELGRRTISDSVIQIISSYFLQDFRSQLITQLLCFAKSTFAVFGLIVIDLSSVQSVVNTTYMPKLSPISMRSIYSTLFYFDGFIHVWM